MHEEWHKTIHLRGEAVCLWLRELQKAGGAARVALSLRGDQFQAISTVSQAIMVRRRSAPNGLGTIRRILEHSAESGSTLAAAQRMRP